MTTDFRALCAELTEKLDDLNCSYNIPSQSALVERARAELAQPEPRSDTCTGCGSSRVDVIRAVAGGAMACCPDCSTLTMADRNEVRRIAREAPALAQPEPEGPTDEELLGLMPQQFRDDLATVSRLASYGTPVEPGIYRVSLNTGALDFARAVLARWGRPTPQPLPVLPEGTQVIKPTEHTLLVPVAQPIPVSERLPGPEDCDAEGRCWFGAPDRPGAVACWDLEREPATDDTHWLPAHALPVPTRSENDYDR